jgi:hypothetical protein
MVPVDVSVSPLGNEPELMVQLYGVVPPEAASGWEYAVLASAFGTELVETVKAAPIAMDRGWVALWLVAELSSPFTVKLYVPAVAGVPEMAPAAANVRPGGRDPDVTVQE